MNNFQIILNLTKLQAEELQSLQREFVSACNFVTQVLLRHRTLSRVLLHQLAYKSLRETFPNLGSQMACNAIYAVSKIYKAVQDKGVQTRLGLPPLSFRPIIFTKNFPIYLDLKTVSFFEGRISIFTLTGRLHVVERIDEEYLELIFRNKVKEILVFFDGSNYVLQVRLKSEFDRVGLQDKDFENFYKHEYLTFQLAA